MRLPPSLSLLLTLPALTYSLACAAPEEGDFFAASADKQDNATGDRWRVPAAVLSEGDNTSISYTGAGPWNGESSCEGDMTKGANSLREYLRARYPQIESIGGYNCRPIVGSPGTTSVHATGRALDIMLPVGFNAEAQNRLGDPIGNFLIANAEDIGIQFIIWDRTSWGAAREAGKKERYYSGQHPHNDHLHIELSVEAGRAQTAWLQPGWSPTEVEEGGDISPTPTPTDPPPPTPADELPPEPGSDEPEEPAPTVPPLGDPQPEDPKPSGVCTTLAASGGVLDESSNCLWLRGPSNYWKREAEGHDDHLAWTTALHSGKHLSSAQWDIKLEQEGNYIVEVYLTPGYASFDKARYYVAHAGSTEEALLDMSAGTGWTTLGTFAFAADGEQTLTLFDNADQAVGDDARIVADAIRLIPENQEPVEPPESEEPPPEDSGDEPSDDGASDPEPDPQPDPGHEGQSDADEEGTDNGLVTAGCQAAPGRVPGSSALFLLLALFALRRRRSM